MLKSVKVGKQVSFLSKVYSGILKGGGRRARSALILFNPPPRETVSYHQALKIYIYMYIVYCIYMYMRIDGFATIFVFSYVCMYIYV